MDFIFPIFEIHLPRDVSENTCSDLSDADFEEDDRADDIKVTTVLLPLFFKQILDRIF